MLKFILFVHSGSSNKSATQTLLKQPASGDFANATGGGWTRNTKVCKFTSLCTGIGKALLLLTKRSITHTNTKLSEIDKDKHHRATCW
jgi:hypothetical protein